MGRKLGAPPFLRRPFLGEGAGSPSNTKSHGLRPTSIPSDALMHPAVWPQWKWAENGEGAPPPFGVAIWHKVAWAEAYLYTKWHLDLCSNLAATYGPKIGEGSAPIWGRELSPHLIQCGQSQILPACQVSPCSVQPFGHNTPTSQTDIQDRQTGQRGHRSDSIGRTVLQTVAQKRYLWRSQFMLCFAMTVWNVRRFRSSRSFIAMIRNDLQVNLLKHFTAHVNCVATLPCLAS